MSQDVDIFVLFEPTGYVNRIDMILAQYIDIYLVHTRCIVEPE